MKSREVPSSKATDTETADEVGIEIGATAAESVGSVRRGCAIVSVTRVAVGACTLTGGKPVARVALEQISHPTETTFCEQSAVAPTGTSTVKRSPVARDCTEIDDESAVTVICSRGTSCSVPSEKTAVASTVPRSPSASSSCESCTEVRSGDAVSHGTPAYGCAAQSTSVTTTVSSESTCTESSETVTVAATLGAVMAPPIAIETAPLCTP